MKFLLHPFAESRVRRRVETTAGVVDDHHVSAPVQLGDQQGPQEIVRHTAPGVAIILDVVGILRANCCGSNLESTQHRIVTGRCFPSDRAASWTIRSVLRDINGSHQCRGFRSNSFSSLELPVSAWNFGIRLSSVSGARGVGVGWKA